MLISWVWLLAIRSSQLAPHRITTTINGRVLTEKWVTNRFFILGIYTPVMTSTGLVNVLHWETNEYWHVWGMFK